MAPPAGGRAVDTVGADARQHGEAGQSGNDRRRRQRELLVAPAEAAAANRDGRFSGGKNAAGRACAPGHRRRTGYEGAGRLSRLARDGFSDLEHAVAQPFRLPSRAVQRDAAVPDDLVDVAREARVARLDRLLHLAAAAAAQPLEHSRRNTRAPARRWREPRRTSSGRQPWVRSR